jgi:ribosomal protein L37AE/L43A
VRFNEADVEDGGSGMASWLRLKIHTRQPQAEVLASQPDPRTCGVCRGDGSQLAAKSEWTSTPCQHHYHIKCLDAWKALEQVQGSDASCPMCRSALG